MRRVARTIYLYMGVWRNEIVREKYIGDTSSVYVYFIFEKFEVGTFSR